MQLLLATRNRHKTQEFAQILGADFVVNDLLGKTEMPVVEETGRTFQENASLKAVSVSRRIDGLVVADDSGLEVEALEGAPGIYSARFAGENATDAKNVRKLLSEIGAAENRSARFRCVIALARDGKTLATFEGEIDGTIATQPRGHNGFGYDSIFIPRGFDRTFAELGDETKNRISHRARAIAQLRDYLTSS